MRAMNEFALVNGNVFKVIRKDHFGDETLWMVQGIDMGIYQRWVPAHDCIPLDPALNVLFERKEND